MLGRNKNNHPPLSVLSSLLESMDRADKQLANRSDAESAEAAVQVMTECSVQVVAVATQILDQIDRGDYIPVQD